MPIERKECCTVPRRNPISGVLTAATLTCARPAGTIAVAGHKQTCPPTDTREEVLIQFIAMTRHGCEVWLFLFSTGQFCALAALLWKRKAASQASLSRVGPWFSGFPSLPQWASTRPLKSDESDIRKSLVAESDQQFMMQRYRESHSSTSTTSTNTSTPFTE